MDECIEVLENSPDSVPSDKTLIHLVKLTHLTEDVGFQFATDDAGWNVSFSNPKVQYTLKAFEQQLAQWKKEIPLECYTRKFPVFIIDRADMASRHETIRTYPQYFHA